MQEAECLFLDCLGSTDGLPKVSLKKLDAYQRALLLGMDPDEEY